MAEVETVGETPAVFHHMEGGRGPPLPLPSARRRLRRLVSFSSAFQSPQIQRSGHPCPFPLIMMMAKQLPVPEFCGSAAGPRPDMVGLGPGLRASGPQWRFVFTAVVCLTQQNLLLLPGETADRVTPVALAPDTHGYENGAHHQACDDSHTSHHHHHQRHRIRLSLSTRR